MGEIINITDKVENTTDNELVERKREAIKKLSAFRGEVLTKNNIRSLPDVKVGDIFWVATDKCAYVVADKDGKKMTIKALDENASISTGMTIYDMNKKIVSKEPIFDWDNEEERNKLYEQFRKFVQEDAPATYYLCYSRDMHYVTLFKVKGSFGFNERSMEMFKQTIDAAGDLISIDFHTDGVEKSAEIWVRTADSPAELMYLFPYDNGLVKLTN